MREFNAEMLTPQGLQDAVQDEGGGVVLSVVVAAQIAGIDGSRFDMTIWDNQSAVSTHWGLADLLHRTQDARVELAVMDSDG